MTPSSRWFAVALVAWPAAAAAQGGGQCDFSKVPGAVWWGTQAQMPVAQLVSYAAPILWFSPDEPSLAEASGADIRVPTPFPGDSVPDHPVLYYQIDALWTRPGEKGSAVLRNPEGPGQNSVELSKVAIFDLSYFAYFPTEEGLGAHPHDIEPAEFRMTVIPSTWEGLKKWIPGGPRCSRPTNVLVVTRVSAKAHGLVWFWNVLDVDQYVAFPFHLLVEEGKHALATDKNGDGVFTKGYDVNRRINDAWGTRDIIRTGTLFSGSYESWMAKTRLPQHRIFPPLPDDSPLRSNLRRRMAGGRYVTYELRPFPPITIAGEDHGLAHLMVDKEVPNWPTEKPMQNLQRWGKQIEEGGVLKSLSIGLRADGDLGLVWVFPFFIVKHLEEPMTGGYIVQRMYLKDDHFHDFGWTALYTPSASRWLDTYLSAGAELDRSRDSIGTTVGQWGFVFETGIKFRVNINETPLKPLNFFTDYWGLRLGIKNRGFFDIDHLSYVFEFGAGAF